MKGTITRVMVDKNFGFITGEDNADYFFHKSSLVNEPSFTQKLRNRSVTFEESESDKGLRAESVYVD
jgi:cold shock CspA family protein